eukprot:546295-Rhodomonas_salina.2
MQTSFTLLVGLALIAFASAFAPMNPALTLRSGRTAAGALSTGFCSAVRFGCWGSAPFRASDGLLCFRACSEQNVGLENAGGQRKFRFLPQNVPIPPTKERTSCAHQARAGVSARSGVSVSVS